MQQNYSDITCLSHQGETDRLYTLTCSIRIWNDDESIEIHECQDIEIESSYRRLVGTAVLSIPYSALSSYRTLIGSRIELRLGYDSADLVFSGYVVRCTVDMVTVLECDDLLSVLRQRSLPMTPTFRSLTAADFLASGSRYDVLRGTGIMLHPHCDCNSIVVGVVDLCAYYSVADLLEGWQKRGIMSYGVLQSDGTMLLRVGYLSLPSGSELNTTDRRLLSYTDKTSVEVIQSDFDVPSGGDNLKSTHVDKRYVAVRVMGVLSDGRYYRSTVRYAARGSSKYEFVNEHAPRSRRSQKRKGGSRGKSSATVKAHQDMRDYLVLPLYSTHTGGSETLFRQEAIAALSRYAGGGVGGTLTTFGDVAVHPGDVVGYICRHHEAKTGFYFVEGVRIRFGVRGYRRDLVMPFKYADLSYTSDE